MCRLPCPLQSISIQESLYISKHYYYKAFHRFGPELRLLPDVCGVSVCVLSVCALVSSWVSSFLQKARLLVDSKLLLDVNEFVHADRRQIQIKPDQDKSVPNDGSRTNRIGSEASKQLLSVLYTLDIFFLGTGQTLGTAYWHVFKVCCCTHAENCGMCKFALSTQTNCRAKTVSEAPSTLH